MRNKFILRFRSSSILLIVIVLFMVIDVSGQKNRPSDLRANLKLIEEVNLTQDKLNQALFTEKSELFVTARNKKNNEWSYQLGTVKGFFSPCSNGENYSFGMPDSKGQNFSLSCPNFSVEMWNLDKAKMTARFQVPKGKKEEDLHSFLSPNGTRIILKPTLLAEEAELWDAANGTKIAVLDSSATNCRFCNRTVYATVFSPDGKRVAVSFGGMVFIYIAENGGLLSSLRDEKVHLYSSDALAHNGVASEILFSDDSQMIFTGSYDGIVKSWDVETGEIMNTFKGHKDRITSLALSPDGKILATGSRDEHFRLWDIETGRLMLKSADHKNRVLILSFSPDGKKILSMTDNQVFIWETATGKLLEQMKSPGELSTRFSPDWRFVFTFDRKKNKLELYEYKGN